VADEERLLEPESSLRLAVCQNLVEGFGGTLRIESRAKRDFRIELRYPLTGDVSQRTKSAAPRHSSNGVAAPEMTALVIDSDTTVQDALLHLLTERGYRVIPVSTAEEGIDLCEHARFDCVFFDALSNGGGPEAYDRIRPLVNRFVFLADTTFAVENGGLPAKDCAVLRKPVESGELDRLLESFVPGADTRDPIEEQPARAG
jgi:CheY-like chemotaxis protein